MRKRATVIGDDLAAAREADHPTPAERENLRTRNATADLGLWLRLGGSKSVDHHHFTAFRLLGFRVFVTDRSPSSRIACRSKISASKSISRCDGGCGLAIVNRGALLAAMAQSSDSSRVNLLAGLRPPRDGASILPARTNWARVVAPLLIARIDAG
jgi:hypothetical protein